MIEVFHENVRRAVLAGDDVWPSGLTKVPANTLETATTRQACFCKIYAWPPGGGLPMHFDSDEVFVLQLWGKKSWRLAENGEGVNTIVTGTAPPEEAKLLGRRSEAVDMRPGSFLYVPAGFW